MLIMLTLLQTTKLFPINLPKCLLLDAHLVIDSMIEKGIAIFGLFENGAMLPMENGMNIYFFMYEKRLSWTNPRGLTC